MRLVYLFFIIITVFSYGGNEGRYELLESKEMRMFFPKGDSEYTDYLLEKDDAEAHLELAIIYLKNGEEERSKDYLSLYLKEENDPRKLLEYYNIGKDYKRIEENLDRIILAADEIKSVKYKKRIYVEIEKKELPISKEKYRVGKVQEFLSYMGDEKKQREFFNSNKWTRGDVRKILDELKKYELPDQSPSKKLFDMFATKKDRLEKRYFSIKGIEDIKGYFDYFDFAKRENIQGELRSPGEELLYLKYEKNIEGYKEAKERFVKEYTNKKNNSTLYTLWIVTGDAEILQYLKTQGEGYHHLYLKDLFKKNKSTLFYSEVKKFLYLYPKSLYRDEVLEKLFDLAGESQRSDLIKKYTGVVESRVLDRERIKIADGPVKIELLEKEISKGNSEYIEELIEELEELYTDVEVAQRLEIIENREPYAVYLIQNEIDIPVRYRGSAAKFLYTAGEKDALYPYRKYMEKSELKELAKEDERYREEYAERYPLEDENINTDQEIYIYFSEDPALRESKVKEIESKKIMDPHEMYYAALYYNKNGDYVKSYRLSDVLNKRYSLSEKIVELHNSNIYKIKNMDIKK
ncbi:hypothetical protein [uncultured Ilyobacter sp.]|uniref:hypothetical protein n=1 Tax=uncultured Ilyobacter sp. TaxID=544433 RepID=UPI0029C7AB36|nr:hypothetical protein [uncultured Ilyobacter sp.]